MYFEVVQVIITRFPLLVGQWRGVPKLTENFSPYQIFIHPNK